MMELPTGTVTMVFTDIEGSTLMLARLGPAYADALDAHGRVLRRAWTAHRGREMGTEGNIFFVAFASAPDAIAAAVRGTIGFRYAQTVANNALLARNRCRMHRPKGQLEPHRSDTRIYCVVPSAS